MEPTNSNQRDSVFASVSIHTIVGYNPSYYTQFFSAIYREFSRGPPCTGDEILPRDIEINLRL